VAVRGITELIRNGVLHGPAQTLSRQLAVGFFQLCHEMSSIGRDGAVSTALEHHTTASTRSTNLSTVSRIITKASPSTISTTCCGPGLQNRNSQSY
jgi:hypothetical protein